MITINTFHLLFILLSDSRGDKVSNVKFLNFKYEMNDVIVWNLLCKTPTTAPLRYLKFNDNLLCKSCFYFTYSKVFIH